VESKAILDRFLNIPISSSQGVFEIFAQLPGAIWRKGEQPLQQFVYIPGTRKDRVVLVAHADTVWDTVYGHPREAKLQFADGIYSSGKPLCGIGADDRAGCAMVWALRDSGHSLLILDGEEKGKIGANYLRKSHKKLFRELNRHRFMLELDWAGVGCCLFNQVDNTPAFKAYIQTAFVDSQRGGGCDLQVLCRDVCGANLSVGWWNWHTPKEQLDIAHWEENLHNIADFLAKTQPQFKIPLKTKLRNFYRKCRSLAGGILRKLGLRN
jgi:hypothetical protein